MNAAGFSTPSAYIEMMPATRPGAPFQPTVSARSSTSISLEWTFDEATYNGGSSIIDYTVYWDNGILG